MTDPLPPSAALPLREGENTLPDSDGLNVPLTEGDERERHCRERRGSLTTTSCAKPLGTIFELRFNLSAVIYTRELQPCYAFGRRVLDLRRVECARRSTNGRRRSRRVAPGLLGNAVPGPHPRRAVDGAARQKHDGAQSNRARRQPDG